MGFWVYGFMGLWVYGFMGLWVYGFMGLWVYGFKFGAQGSGLVEVGLWGQGPKESIWRHCDILVLFLGFRV